MANVTVIAGLKQILAYLQDGNVGTGFVNAIVQQLTPAEKLADNLVLYRYAGISTTKDEVDDDAGAKPLLIIAQSTGTECYIHLHNADADSVTAGVDVDFLVPVSGTSGECTYVACGGKGWDSFWDTGLTASASTLTETSSAPANTPNLYILHTGA